jgi:hypothetical protein
MRRTHLVIVVAIVLATGLLLGAQKQAKGWEYARLRYGYGAFGKHVNWSWSAPGVFVESVNVNELCKKLKVQPPNSKNPLSLVDWAGSQGWELVTMESVEAEFTVAAWFKRQK